MITSGLTVSYVWEIIIPADIEDIPLKADFAIEYICSNCEEESTEKSRVYHYYFSIKDYLVCL